MTTRPGVRFAFSVILVLIVALVFEGRARLIFTIEDALHISLGHVDPPILDDYEIADIQHPWNWRPRPGYSATLGQSILAKKQAGKILGESFFRDRAAQLMTKRVGSCAA